MVDINEYKKDFKMFCDKAAGFLKEEKYEEAVRFYNKAKVSLENLIKFDENKYNKPVYEDKKKEVEKKIEELQKKKKKVAAKEGGGSGENDEDQALKDQLSGCLVTEMPNVSWDDVAGLENAKQALKEAVILPIQYPQLFEGKRQPWKGILLYGPPGTGKSYLAKAAATETKGRFFSVSAANIVSKFMGESERLIKALFELARKNKPAVIFIDEIDSVLSARSEGENEATRRLKTEFLIQMQGVGKDDKGILVLGATNIPWGLDPAVRRRFQKKIYISLPESNARKLMLKLNLGDTYNDLTDEQFKILGDLTEGYSGSDIYNLTQDAIYGPLRKCQRATHFKYLDAQQHLVPCSPSDQGAMEMKINDIQNPEKLVAPVVTFEDFILSLQKMKPTVSKEDLKRQDEFTKEFGTEG
jgi:vacuolar protein-sorting-associated protein 4